MAIVDSHRRRFPTTSACHRGAELPKRKVAAGLDAGGFREGVETYPSFTPRNHCESMTTVQGAIAHIGALVQARAHVWQQMKDGQATKSARRGRGFKFPAATPQSATPDASSHGRYGHEQ